MFIKSLNSLTNELNHIRYNTFHKKYYAYVSTWIPLYLWLSQRRNLWNDEVIVLTVTEWSIVLLPYFMKAYPSFDGVYVCRYVAWQIVEILGIMVVKLNIKIKQIFPLIIYRLVFQFFYHSYRRGFYWYDSCNLYSVPERFS